MRNLVHAIDEDNSHSNYFRNSTALHQLCNAWLRYRKSSFFAHSFLMSYIFNRRSKTRAKYPGTQIEIHEIVPLIRLALQRPRTSSEAHVLCSSRHSEQQIPYVRNFDQINHRQVKAARTRGDVSTRIMRKFLELNIKLSYQDFCVNALIHRLLASAIYAPDCIAVE